MILITKILFYYDSFICYHFEIEDSAEGLHLKKASIMQPNLSALIAFYKHTQQKDLPHPLATW